MVKYRRTSRRVQWAVQLLEMGFNEADVEEVLAGSVRNLEEAIAQLLQRQGEHEEEDNDDEEGAEEEAEEEEEAEAAEVEEDAVEEKEAPAAPQHQPTAAEAASAGVPAPDLSPQGVNWWQQAALRFQQHATGGKPAAAPALPAAALAPSSSSSSSAATAEAPVQEAGISSDAAPEAASAPLGTPSKRFRKRIIGKRAQSQVDESGRKKRRLVTLNRRSVTPSKWAAITKGASPSPFFPRRNPDRTSASSVSSVEVHEASASSSTTPADYQRLSVTGPVSVGSPAAKRWRSPLKCNIEAERRFRIEAAASPCRLSGGSRASAGGRPSFGNATSPPVSPQRKSLVTTPPRDEAPATFETMPAWMAGRGPRRSLVADDLPDDLWADFRNWAKEQM